jgi:hypothetical protein
MIFINYAGTVKRCMTWDLLMRRILLYNQETVGPVALALKERGLFLKVDLMAETVEREEMF